MNNWQRRLVWHGMFLFLLGLLTGLVSANMTNPRMGLAAHLEGVMNGTFLIAVGAIWHQVQLAPRQKALTVWCALYGTYANWTNTTLAALFGTGAMTPIAAAGRTALPWQETMVAAGFVSVALAIMTAVVLMLWGLRAKASA